MKYPESIIIEDGGLVLDGGSIHLDGRDPEGGEVSIRLNWSIRAQENAATELKFNDHVVSKRSLEEERVLDLLRNATIEPSDDEEEPGDRISENRHAVGRDIEDFFGAIDEGPEEALRCLVQQVVEKVLSDVHTDGRRYRRNPRPQC